MEISINTKKLPMKHIWNSRLEMDHKELLRCCTRESDFSLQQGITGGCYSRRIKEFSHWFSKHLLCAPSMLSQAWGIPPVNQKSKEQRSTEGSILKGRTSCNNGRRQKESISKVVAMKRGRHNISTQKNSNCMPHCPGFTSLIKLKITSKHRSLWLQQPRNDDKGRQQGRAFRMEGGKKRQGRGGGDL